MHHITVPGKSMLRENFPCDLPDSARSNTSRKPDFSGQRSFREDGEVVFGSHHQGEDMFGEFSRGSQCTCMALMMLISASEDFQFNRYFVDRVMKRGDILYTTVVIDLKTEGRFVDKLLSLDELPTSVSVDVKYQITKHVISTGFAVTEPTCTYSNSLQQALESALELSRFVLIMVGGICSSVYKHKSNRLIFFDSHSHGLDGMSSHGGKAIMVSYESLNDLVIYLYAFYSSKDMKLTSQFEALPISIKAID
ncbi:unnamed protein product [Meganyctiphanes norvegica]|uniref:Uncharacterized protein n=1 Tax=Meganyctiphanes norvegica TaxID=48144 RepID=A0AAV2RRC5_MEGNR